MLEQDPRLEYEEADEKDKDDDGRMSFVPHLPFSRIPSSRVIAAIKTYFLFFSFSFLLITNFPKFGCFSQANDRNDENLFLLIFDLSFVIIIMCRGSMNEITYLTLLSEPFARHPLEGLKTKRQSANELFFFLSYFLQNLSEIRAR